MYILGLQWLVNIFEDDVNHKLVGSGGPAELATI